MNPITDEQTSEKIKITDLNDDVINIIFKQLNRSDQIKFRSVNKDFRYDRGLREIPKFMVVHDIYYFYRIENLDFKYKDEIVTFDDFSFQTKDPNDLYFFKLMGRDVIFTSDKFIFKKDDKYIVYKFETKIETIIRVHFYETIIIKTKDFFYFYCNSNLYKSEYPFKKELNVYLVTFKIDSTTSEFSIYINKKNIAEIITYRKKNAADLDIKKGKNNLVSKLNLNESYVKFNLKLISDFMDNIVKTNDLKFSTYNIVKYCKI
jgi:hypothetical protein